MTGLTGSAKGDTGTGNMKSENLREREHEEECDGVNSKSDIDDASSNVGETKSKTVERKKDYSN